MEKRNLLIYRISTGLFTALMALGIFMYIFQTPVAIKSFTKLGYPTYLIYPLATAKFLGLIAILTKKSKTLKEWAYAGFVFDLILAVFSHLAIADGEFPAAFVALILVLTSYIFEKKIATAKLT